jgi:hypothetical protein
VKTQQISARRFNMCDVMIFFYAERHGDKRRRLSDDTAGSGSGRLAPASATLKDLGADTRSFSTATDDSSVYSDNGDNDMPRTTATWPPTGSERVADNDDGNGALDQKTATGDRCSTARCRQSAGSDGEQMEPEGAAGGRRSKSYGLATKFALETEIEKKENHLGSPKNFCEDTVISSEPEEKTATDGDKFDCIPSSIVSSNAGSGHGVDLLGKLFPHASKDDLERTLRRCSGNVVQSIEQLLQLTATGGGGKHGGSGRTAGPTASPEAESSLTRSHSQLIPYHNLHNGTGQHQQSAQGRYVQQPNAGVDVPPSSPFSPFSFHHQSPYFRPNSTALVGPPTGPFPLVPPGSGNAPNIPFGVSPGGTASAVHQAAAAAVEAMRHAVYGAPGCPATPHPPSSSSVGAHPSLPPTTHPSSTSSSSIHHGARVGLPPAGASTPNGTPFGMPYSPAAAAAAFLPTFAGLRYNYGAVMAAAAMFHASAVAAAASAATNGAVPPLPSEGAARGADRTSPTATGKGLGVAGSLVGSGGSMPAALLQQSYSGGSLFSGGAAYGKSPAADHATSSVVSSEK